jgi:hypothetical protein
MEQGPIWKLRRLRFSLAHELGHFFLHKNHHSYSSPLKDFENWINSNSSDKYKIEYEANEFAGSLLVPTNRLKFFYEEYERQVKAIIPGFKDSGSLRSGFCDSAREIFQVGSDTIGIRLDREVIWEAN